MDRFQELVPKKSEYKESSIYSTLKADAPATDADAAISRISEIRLRLQKNVDRLHSVLRHTKSLPESAQSGSGKPSAAAPSFFDMLELETLALEEADEEFGRLLSSFEMIFGQ
jgi:hypothetical protein